MTAFIGRREFIALLGGVPAWPLAARAQQAEQVRRIGVLMNLAADDPLGQPRLAAFQQGLQELGWTEGRNVQIGTRWAAGKADRFRTYAAELVGLAPDVILAATTAGVTAVQQASRAVPIVFVIVVDPVSAVSSPIWRGLAQTRLDLPCMNMPPAQNGWNFSSRSRPA